MCDKHIHSGQEIEEKGLCEGCEKPLDLANTVTYDGIKMCQECWKYSEQESCACLEFWSGNGLK